MVDLPQGEVLTANWEFRLVIARLKRNGESAGAGRLDTAGKIRKKSQTTTTLIIERKEKEEEGKGANRKHPKLGRLKKE